MSKISLSLENDLLADQRSGNITQLIITSETMRDVLIRLNVEIVTNVNLWFMDDLTQNERDFVHIMVEGAANRHMFSSPESIKENEYKLITLRTIVRHIEFHRKDATACVLGISATVAKEMFIRNITKEYVNSYLCFQGKGISFDLNNIPKKEGNINQTTVSNQKYDHTFHIDQTNYIPISGPFGFIQGPIDCENWQSVLTNNKS